jgi:hypothetical protein
MIMNKLFNPLRQFNYKYVVGELLLIFIGISLSLYFDEWRTNRTERKREMELLTQLTHAVQSDTSRINWMIKINEEYYKQMTYLIDTGRFEIQPTKKTINYLSRIEWFFIFKPDLSAYENIKQEGFTIISDPSIKEDMVHYYQEMADLTFWTEWKRDNHFQEFNSYKFDAFSVFTWDVEAIPEDFDKLKADNKFWKLLRESKRVYGVTSKDAKEKKEIAIQFLNEIKKLN